VQAEVAKQLIQLEKAMLQPVGHLRWWSLLEQTPWDLVVP
jgi:hypothetical protein